MEKQNDHYGWLRTGLELGPLVIFLWLYIRYRNDSVAIWGQNFDGLVFATLVAIPLILTATLVLWLVTGRLSPLQIFAAIMILVFGSLTVWFNDARFIKTRPTIVYTIMAGILGFGLMTGRLYLKMLTEGQFRMRSRAWRVITARAIVFLVAMAVLNEVTWRFFSDDIWVALDKIGQPILFILFFVAHIGFFIEHGKRVKSEL